MGVFVRVWEGSFVGVLFLVGLFRRIEFVLFVLRVLKCLLIE